MTKNDKAKKIREHFDDLSTAYRDKKISQERFDQILNQTEMLVQSAIGEKLRDSKKRTKETKARQLRVHLRVTVSVLMGSTYADAARRDGISTHYARQIVKWTVRPLCKKEMMGGVRYKYGFNPPIELIRENAVFFWSSLKEKYSEHGDIFNEQPKDVEKKPKKENPPPIDIVPERDDMKYKNVYITQRGRWWKFSRNEIKKFIPLIIKELSNSETFYLNPEYAMKTKPSCAVRAKTRPVGSSGDITIWKPTKETHPVIDTYVWGGPWTAKEWQEFLDGMI